MAAPEQSLPFLPFEGDEDKDTARSLDQSVMFQIRLPFELVSRKLASPDHRRPLQNCAPRVLHGLTMANIQGTITLLLQKLQDLVESNASVLAATANILQQLGA